MLAVRLQTTRYETSRGPGTESVVENPGWRDIEAAVRRLDRDRFPFAFVYFDPDSRQDDVPDVEIIGGCGAYLIHVRLRGRMHAYFDASRGEEEFEIWESDQGASVPGNRTCGDLNLVLEIAKEACESGRLLPGVDWIEPTA